MGDLIQAQVRELFTYDPETGWLKWKTSGSGRHLERAGGPGPGGYRYVIVKRKMLLEHRVIWLLVHGELPREIDHVNRVRGDNRLINLRAATRAQNCINSVNKRGSNTGFRGVYRIPGNRSRPFLARIKVNSRSLHLGVFSTAEEASAVVLAARRQKFGEFVDPSLWGHT